eukprot:2908892-Rhodomonas_salina.1
MSRLLLRSALPVTLTDTPCPPSAPLLQAPLPLFLSSRSSRSLPPWHPPLPTVETLCPQLVFPRRGRVVVEEFVLKAREKERRGAQQRTRGE